MSLIEEPEIPIDYKLLGIAFVKRFAVFVITPIFLVSLNLGFWTAAIGRQIHWSFYVFGVLLLVTLVAYLVMVNRMFNQLSFPPLRRRQVIAWAQGWIAVYIINFLVFATRFKLDLQRTHWQWFLAIYALLFVITLPIAAWFPKKYREIDAS